MGILGSVKNRIRTRFIINRNIKKKKELEEETKKDKAKEEKKAEQKVTDSILSQTVNIQVDTAKENKTSAEIPFINIQQEKKPKTTEEKPIIKQNKKEEPKSLKITEEKPYTSSLEEIKDTSIEKEKIKEYVKIFISNTKKEIKKLKNEIKDEEKELEKVKNVESLEKEKEKIVKLHQRIIHLKEIIQILLNKYDFNGYDELKDSLLLKYIDDFEFKNTSTDIDSLVEECKIEIIKIEGISELASQLLDIETKKDNKQNKIEELDLDYNNRTNDFYHLERTKETIKRYIEKEEQYLSCLSEELKNNTTNTKIESHLVLDKNYLNNLVNLGIGLTTFQTTYIGAFLGAFIIKNATSKLLRGAFKREEKIIYYYKYQEYIEKIESNLDLVENTIYLLDNAIKDLEKFKRHMEANYKEYLEVEKYKKLYQKIDAMAKELLIKKEKSEQRKKELLEKKEKNKTRQKKLKDLSA